ncbi:MAG: hypothetical protein ACKPKO_00140, partial [Candidatus Fonsibacter sp.]
MVNYAYVLHQEFAEILRVALINPVALRNTCLGAGKWLSRFLRHVGNRVCTSEAPVRRRPRLWHAH